MSEDRPPNTEEKPSEEATPEDEAPTKRESGEVQLELREDASAIQKFGFKILMSRSFERIMGVVIGVNFVVVIVEIDNNAKDAESDDWVWYASWGLLATFVIELVTKLFVLRSQFWRQRWNVFDFVVIAIDSLFSLLEVFGLSFLNVSMLRILRLSRLARATKVFRMFPELKLMMAGLTCSFKAIFWGSVLLFVALLVWSVLAVQFIHPLNKKVHAESNVYDGCPRCPRAYESTFQACLTFTTQIVAGDSWGRETQPIIERNPASAVFFLSVYVSVGLAIMNLILGVVVNVATEARDRLLKEEADEKLLMSNESLSSLLTMCQEMDDDGNDELTFDEIRGGFDSNEDFRNTLMDMDIGRDDLQIVWTILDSDRSGTVTSKEFVNQIYKMKNSDSQFMLAYIKFYITEIKDKLRGDLSKIGAKLDTDLAHFDEAAHLVEEQVHSIDASTWNLQMQVDANKAQIAGNTGRIASKIGGSSDTGLKNLFCESCSMELSIDCGICECGTIFKSDATFCHKCGRAQSCIQRNEAEQAVGRAPFAVEHEGKAAANSNGQPVPRELSNLMFDSGSLREMLESVKFTDLGEAPSLQRESLYGDVSDPAELLARLENVWQQCIVSIDDMRNFHMSLADLLESTVRRVSITIHHTVSASVASSTSKMPGMIRSAARLSEAAESRSRLLSRAQGYEANVLRDTFEYRPEVVRVDSTEGFI